jgi:hypothetical protein
LTYSYVRWHARLLAGEDLNLVDLAAYKLIDRSVFHPTSKDQVLALLSQRIFLDPLLASLEVVALADRSLTSHMRKLTGISTDGRKLYTYSASEPLLTLGAIQELYKENNIGLWAKILDTFTCRLCSAGLVEKGLSGEIASRILLIIAREFAAPYNANGKGRNLLEPVLVLHLLDKLFGKTTWCPPKERTAFESVFSNTYVNYTHIVVTKEPLPKNPSR